MRKIRIALIGYKGIGRMHSHGYRNVLTFFDLDAIPILKIICGRDRDSVCSARDKYGWEEWSTDWTEVVRRKDVDLVDVCTTNDLHCQISVAAAKAGKDVVCEKPLARNLGEVLEMVRAVQAARVRHMISFNYRFVPAVRLAKEIIEEGQIGEIHEWRARWLTELMDPTLPLSWFFQKDKAGYGASGDIGSHIIDLAQYLVGTVIEVASSSQILTHERPIEGGGGRMGRVDVDDAVQFLARFEHGAIGVFEASRCAGGYRDEFEIELNGSKGTLCFNSKILHELRYYSTMDDKRVRGFRTIFVGNEFHPYKESICPYGEIIGRSDVFIIQAYEILRALATGANLSPDFKDGARCQAVLEAVAASSISKKWEIPDYSQIDAKV